MLSMIPAQGGARRKICGDCGPTSSLSPDGKQFLSSRADGSRPAIDVVDVDSGKSTQVLKHSKYPLGRPRFSPDGKWIVFLVLRGAALVDVMLAPFRGARSVPYQDWISVTSAPGNVNQVFWSPDSELLYYVINTAGSYSLMGRRLDRNHHPVSPPFRVYEFSGRFHPSSGPSLPADALTAVPGRFIGAMPEFTYNIWMMDLPK